MSTDWKWVRGRDGDRLESATEVILIAESVAPQHARLIARAPKMHEMLDRLVNRGEEDHAQIRALLAEIDGKDDPP